MKKPFVLLFVCCLFTGAAFAQQTVRRCGNDLIMQRMAAANPAAMAAFRAQRQTDINNALAQSAASAKNLKKTTAGPAPVPVVFHFVVSHSVYVQLGNNQGLINRVLSNLATINRDYNAKNADTTAIPAYFKSRFADVGIQFGLANATSANTIAPGIELLQVSPFAKFDVDSSCSLAKKAGTGLPAWDVDKYLNVWICAIADGSTSNTILGITVNREIEGDTVDGHVYAASEVGVCITPFAFGARLTPDENYITNFELGRTLTHEVGHFFGIYHPWGDDGGKCPGDRDPITHQQVGFDDGFSDTPPEADYASGSPAGVVTDACSNVAPGIMYQNYMDYTNDNALVMFTHQQAVYMLSTIVPGHYNAGVVADASLSFAPQISYLGVNTISPVLAGTVSAAPNPAYSELHIAISSEALPRAIELVDMLGRIVARVPIDGSKNYTLATGSLPRGVYTLACRFDGGLVTQKIILE